MKYIFVSINYFSYLCAQIYTEGMFYTNTFIHL